MGTKDALTYNYMNDNARFADIMNFYLYAGKQVIRPENLKSLAARKEVDDARKEVDDIRRANDDIRKNSLLEQCSILRNIMQKLSVSAAEAMNIAGIPEEKRPVLAAELENAAKA